MSSTSQIDGLTLEERKADGQTSAEKRTADGQTSAKKRKADGQTSAEPQGISYMHIRCLLHEVQREGSAGDFTGTVKLMQSSGAQIPPGNAGKKVFSNLVTLGGALEKRHTRHFLKNACLLSLAHDAKDPYLLAHIGGVIWKLQNPLEGAKERLRSILPEGGPPYMFDRLLFVQELTHKNRSGKSAAKELLNSVAALAGAHVDEVIPKVKYDVKDNAADEAVCGRTLQETFTECINLGDTMHTLQLILKDSVAGEPLVVLARSFLIGNTEPHKSVSSMLAHSSRLRSLFKENQAGDSLAVLSGMNWAPQRIASQSRPYGRASLKFGAIIGMLAEEAETANGSEDRAAARFNLTGLASYRVSMTNALMGDLTFEHRQSTLWSDQDQPDISEFDAVVVDLLSRLRVWFEEGLIMSDDGAASDTYTRQVLDFYRSPRFAYSGNYAYLFALPADEHGFFEPLEGVRVIVGNLKDGVLRQFPPNCLQRLFRAFRLVARGDKTDSSADKDDLLLLLQKTGMRSKKEREETVRELSRLRTSAQRAKDSGATTHQAWARASVEFPELKNGRRAVNLLLGAKHSTGGTERWLKKLSEQLRDNHSQGVINNLMLIQAS